MAYTLTSTRWGDLKVTYSKEGQFVAEGTCRFCGAQVTYQNLLSKVNPLTIQPKHKAGCKVLEQKVK